MTDPLREALIAMCEEYEPMNARNEDVRFGADVVLRRVRELLAACPHPDCPPGQCEDRDDFWSELKEDDG